MARQKSNDDLAAIRTMYDREARRYDRVMKGRFGRWLVRDARDKAAAQARGYLLEVGIGTGASLPFYRPEIHVSGIDLSPGMLEVARHRMRELGRDGDLREMDAQVLDFPDHHFDSVAFNLVLCTIPDPARALREAVRVARPGAPMTFLEHVRSDRPWVALPQDLLNPVISRCAHDRINLRTEHLIRGADIEILSVERWSLGIVTLILGRAP